MLHLMSRVQRGLYALKDVIWSWGGDLNNQEWRVSRLYGEAVVSNVDLVRAGREIVHLTEKSILNLPE